MNANYSLLFYLKKPKNYVQGKPKPIYMRITVEGIPKELSAGRDCDPKKWSSRVNRGKGDREDTRLLNRHLESLETRIEEIHTRLIREGVKVTAQVIKNRYLGVADKPHYLMEVFADHNAKIEALIGKGFKPNTLKGYKTSFSHMKSYLLKCYRKPDVDVCVIDYAFVNGYEFYLQSAKNCCPTTTAKYMVHFQKITNLCLAFRWIKEDPFVFYKNTAQAKEREYLTQEELDVITQKHFSIQRLAQVRDIFVFSCYTGLAYIDVKKLRRTNLKKGVDGNLWIFTDREKTGSVTHIPLMSGAIDLANHYSDHPECVNKGLMFPVLSNQRMNSYLKEIADVCGITKSLTFHMARHTFATTVTLNNNVPIETVSKMLGHKSIKTTQHYAKVLDLKVGKDMALLNQKYGREK